MDESKLINRCIRKDPLAWNEFVKRYSRLVYWAIEDRLKKWDYLYQPEDIEEIHQNIFLSLWKKNKLEQIKTQAKISSWLVIVSGNEAIDYFRFQRSQSPPNAISLFEEVIKKDKAIVIADTLASYEDDPLNKNEIGNILETEINNLIAKEKLVLKLNVLYNKKYREIAEMLDMPLGTVCTILKNVRVKLRKRLKGKLRGCW